MQSTVNRLAAFITDSLREKGYMAAWSARLLTNEMMQALVRATAYTMVTGLDEGTDARAYLTKLEVAVNDVIETWFN